jgi:tripartite-type tricarboxylate transporter receptor subunit TctC
MLLLGTVATPLLAQNFPTKSIRLIVPFPPGGGVDNLVRVLTPALNDTWKHVPVVDYRPGASGQIGTDAVAQSAPDGYTVLVTSLASITSKNIDQFTPITLLTAAPYVIAIHPSVPANSIAELIALARARPGKIAFGSSGAGAASHLSGELFKAMAGVDLLHVPYKGTGQAAGDLVAGHVQMMFSPSQTIMPQVRAGKLKALAMTGPRRSELLPGMPTVAESGVPGYQALGWFGVLVPVKTPAALVQQLNSDFVAALRSSAVREKMLAQGVEPQPMSSEEFGQFIRADQARWAALEKRMQ